MQQKIENLAKENNWDISPNLPKIIRAKNMMFGEAEWERCPCAGTNADRYCGSELCASDIEEKKKCHCNLFLKKEK